MSDSTLKPPQHQARWVEFDGLRGLAALVVVFGHLFGTLPVPLLLRHELAVGPFSILINGAPAIHIFFVLSGFVLAHTLIRNDRNEPLRWPGYLVRRAFRLHPPFVGALLFTWGASFFYASPHTPNIGPVAVRFLPIHLSRRELLAAVLAFPNYAFDQLPIGWTLYVESVYSCLLPLLVMASLVSPLLLVAIALTMAAVPTTPVWPFFCLNFAAGVLLYRNRDGLADAAARWPWIGVTALTAGLVLSQFPAWVGWQTPTTVYKSGWCLGFGVLSAILVASSALTSPTIRRCLSIQPFQFLGRISYSLYLVHFPLTLLVAGWAAPWVTPSRIPFAALGVLAASISLAAISYRLVEAPSQNLGRKLARRIDGYLTPTPRVMAKAP